jgi:V8-like Glu-specific endopeptidase
MQLRGVFLCLFFFVPACSDNDSHDNNNNSKMCGDGMCGADETALQCPDDCAPCNEVPFQGCCDGNTLFWCDTDTLRMEQCVDTGCGWSGSPQQGYVCGGTGSDPASEYPRTCGCETSKSRSNDVRPIRPTTRIYNGVEYPELSCLTSNQILSIGALVSDFGDGLENYCTATLITDDAVLTAAHCLQDDWGSPLSTDEFFFVIGDDVLAPLATFEASDFWIHPDYNDLDAYHDLGVIVLNTPASVQVPEIEPLPINANPLGPEFVDRVVQNVGYGVTQDDWYNSIRWWTTEPVVEIGDYEFVVFGNGVSSVCSGDSGGPSLYGRGTVAPHILGTVSWGDSSCVDYDYYCRVDANQAFLDPFVSEWDPCYGLDESGRCIGNIAQWCENGVLHQQCCADNCLTDGMGHHRCTNEIHICDEIDPQGRCEGDMLIWCDEAGNIRRRFCNICENGTCGWVGGAVGFNCLTEG